MKTKSKKTKAPAAPKSRFTKAQQELAHKIVNDIAEGIDCKESREDLRMALAYYADLLMNKHIQWVGADHKLLMTRLGWRMFQAGLQEAEGE